MPRPFGGPRWKLHPGLIGKAKQFLIVTRECPKLFGGVASGFSRCRRGPGNFLLERLWQAQRALRMWLAKHYK